MRIADFGLAKVIFSNNDMTMDIGTPLCMAPEIYDDNNNNYTNKVDVYAFAFFLFLMFSSTIEIEGVKNIHAAPFQYMVKIKKGKRPYRRPEIPDVYWELITRCWDENPEKRPSFVEITNMLRSDKYAINEFGLTTDLDQLHEYWGKMDPPNDPQLIKSAPTLRIYDDNGKSFLTRVHSSSLRNSSIVTGLQRKDAFNWHRH